jgi:hypothetical protein
MRGHLAKLAVFGALIGIGATYAGCGGEESSQQKLSALMQEEADEACEQAVRLYDDIVPLNDRVAGLCQMNAVIITGVLVETSDLDSEVRNDCSELLTECNEKGADSFKAKVNSKRCQGVAVPGNSCEATVGEYHRCAADLAEAQKRFFASTPACSQISVSSLLNDEFGDPLDFPDSCVELSEKCRDASPSFPGITGFVDGMQNPPIVDESADSTSASVAPAAWPAQLLESRSASVAEYRKHLVSRNEWPVTAWKQTPTADPHRR